MVKTAITKAIINIRKGKSMEDEVTLFKIL